MSTRVEPSRNRPQHRPRRRFALPLRCAWRTAPEPRPRLAAHLRHQQTVVWLDPWFHRAPGAAGRPGARHRRDRDRCQLLGRPLGRRSARRSRRMKTSSTSTTLCPRLPRHFLGWWRSAAVCIFGLATGMAQPVATADGFALPQPGHRFEFPRDHGAHPEFKLEWWYVTLSVLW